MIDEVDMDLGTGRNIKSGESELRKSWEISYVKFMKVKIERPDLQYFTHDPFLL